MHPIERLRWIARDRDEAPTTLAIEAAWAISDLALDDPAAVVTACRRLVESHVSVGPLWYLAASVLIAPEPDQAARRVAAELVSDPTAELLAAGMSDRLLMQAPVVVVCPAETVVEALSHRAVGTVRVVGSSPGLRGQVRRYATLGSQVDGWEIDEAVEAVRGAAAVLIEVLAAGSPGVLVSAAAALVAKAAQAAPVPLWAVAGVGRVLNDQLFEEVSRRAGDSVQFLAADSFDLVAGPAGFETPVQALSGRGCPPAPELLVRAR